MKILSHKICLKQIISIILFQFLLNTPFAYNLNDVNIQMIDRSNLNTIPILSSYNKANCDKITNTELQSYSLGNFLCGQSLNASTSANIPIYYFTTLIPHFQRSISVDTYYMNNLDPLGTITIKPDDQPEDIVQMNTLQTRLEVICLNSGSGIEKDIDQFYRGSFLYQKYSSQSIRVAFDSSCNGNTISYLRMSGMQININPCHPSCQTCNGPNSSDCLTCATASGASGPPVGGVCTCTNSSNFFQYGNCVATCDEANFLFKSSTNLCIYNPNCKTFSNDNCTECQSTYFLFNGQCLTYCPYGYIVNAQNCVSQNINIYDGKTYFSGLWRKDFSMIEINQLGLTMSNYLKYNDNSSVYSRCKDTNIYGGFFVNQFNSVITFPTMTNDKQYVKITFKYYLIDYNHSGSTQIFVHVNSGGSSAQLEITASTSGQSNICGLSTIDIVDVFSTNFEISTLSDFQVTILNQNQSSKTLTGATTNAHSYFGIREIEIFGFNCQFDFCMTCNFIGCEICINGYFLNTTTQQCEICNPLCKTCSSLTECITYNSSKQCTCQDGFYLDSINITCIACSEVLCKTCNPLNPSQCTSCYSPKVLSQANICIDNCPTQQYADSNNKCQNCLNTDCLTCNSSNSNLCLSCTIPKYLANDQCVDNCPDSQYGDTIQRKCIPCSNPNCKTCNPPPDNKCQSCGGTLALQNNDCVQDCPDSFYKDINNNSCIQCQGQYCKTCDAPASTNCQSCLSPTVLQGQNCLISCIPGYYQDSQNICQRCSNVSCETCDQLNSNLCLTCPSGKVFYLNDCLTQCPDGFYQNPNSGYCQQCQDTNCKTCDPNNPINCIVCLDSFVKKEGVCLSSCGNKYYQLNQDCFPCLDQSCKSCDNNDSTKCLSCDSPLVLLNNKCANSCLRGMYLDISNNECKNCNNINCLTCNPINSLECSSCQSPKILLNKDCVDQCDPNMYVNSKNECQFCTNPNSTCKSCFNSTPSKCESCDLSLVLLGSDCVTDCGEGFVLNPLTRVCENCSNPTCQTCLFSNKQECLTCKSGLVLNKVKDCISSCGDQMYEQNQICYECLDQNCKQCQPNSMDCTECSPPKSLLQNKCVTECGDGYLSVNNICVPCINTSCKSCNPSNTTQCLSCQPPQVLLNQQCINSCGDMYYLDKLTNTCNPCSPKCKICSDKSFCYECILDNYNLNGYCLSQCPKNKFYQNQTLKICEQCKDPNCIDCSQDASQCSQCQVGYIKSLLSPQKCEKCIHPDCQNEEDKKTPHPSYPNSATQKAITGLLAGISTIMITLSPFYMFVSFFDLLQVTNYLVFINVNYSSTLYSFLQLFSFANFEVIPNIKNTNSEAPTKFRQEDYDTVIFSNLIQSLVIWLISFALYLISQFAQNLKYAKISQFFKYYRQNYKYNIIIGLGFLTYCDIILSVFLQLQNTENIDAYNIAGVICSIVFIFFLLLLNLIAFTASFYFSPRKHQRLTKYFYQGIYKKKSFMNLIFLLRKTMIIYTLVFKQDYPIYQALQILLIIGLETTFMQIINPYKSKKELIFNIFGRLMILFSITLITFMTLDDSIDNIKNWIRQFFEVIIICNLACLYLSQIYYLINQWIKHK